MLDTVCKRGGPVLKLSSLSYSILELDLMSYFCPLYCINCKLHISIVITYDVASFVALRRKDEGKSHRSVCPIIQKPLSCRSPGPSWLPLLISRVSSLFRTPRQGHRSNLKGNQLGAGDHRESRQSCTYELIGDSVRVCRSATSTIENAPQVEAELG